LYFVVLYKNRSEPRGAAFGRPAAIRARLQQGETCDDVPKKGQSGNPAGRPRGARNKLTLLAESLFEADAADLVRKLIEVAKSGDVAALRLCIDRICPPQRDRTVALELPPMMTAADAVAGMGTIMQAIGVGDLGAQEAGEFAKVVAGFSQTVTTAQLENRLGEIERAIALLKRE